MTWTLKNWVGGAIPARRTAPVAFVDLGPAPRITSLNTRWLHCKCQASRSHNFSGTTTHEFRDSGWPSTRTSTLKYSIWVVYVISGNCGLAGSKKRAEISQSQVDLFNLAAQRTSFLMLGDESTKCNLYGVQRQSSRLHVSSASEVI